MGNVAFFMGKIFMLIKYPYFHGALYFLCIRQNFELQNATNPIGWLFQQRNRRPHTETYICDINQEKIFDSCKRSEGMDFLFPLQEIWTKALREIWTKAIIQSLRGSSKSVIKHNYQFIFHAICSTNLDTFASGLTYLLFSELFTLK